MAGTKGDQITNKRCLNLIHALHGDELITGKRIHGKRLKEMLSSMFPEKSENSILFYESCITRILDNYDYVINNNYNSHILSCLNEGQKFLLIDGVSSKRKNQLYVKELI